MTIRIACKSCGSKIDAKDELLGQIRRCPKCRNPILIQPEIAPSDARTTEIDVNAPLKIRRLRPDNLYFILGSDREIAYWKANEGWFVNVGNGFVAVNRAHEILTEVGSFVLVEGRATQTEHGRRLKGLRFSQLSGRGVLKALAYGGEADILEKAKEPAIPTGAQKRMTLQHIRNHFFFEFTDDAPEIVEYLQGFDSHLHEIGTFVDE